ncbi:HPC2-domain-containing protein [Cucurbitaria berberidis CBS 394.84]|uniref:HPC2-domain-containing protein n=1 Tax=Cucurbitaria berberidis CBS 394.84 TaxID=1168544 RepID=A0A9P4L6H1_9PLEO|nr:HPC2-domain-containing protein [Cucurbitaria berberidis CBS 394.84]KAF1843815.1 HPC2-domain-containing protein [Cucurbitaria berberidis CBS 394.84]
MDMNDASSPGSLSSPPHSPEQGTPNATTRVSTGGVGGGANTPAPATASPATRGLTASGQPRKKPGPKPKPKDPNAPEPEKKARKTRKVAEPKDATTAPVQRKRRTKASLDAPAAAAIHVDEKSPVQQSPTPQPRPSEPVPVPMPVVQPELPPAVTQPPRVLSNAEPNFHNNPTLSHITVAPSTPRPSSSGQRYDPIRGGIFETKPQPPVSVPPPISPPLNRASASPSITSLIDPPSASNSFYSHPAKLQQQQPSVTSAPASPAGFSTRPGPILSSQDMPPQPPPQQQQQQQQPPQCYPATSAGTTPMEIDSDPSKHTSIPMAKSSSTHSLTPSHSNAPTPPAKTARQKEAPPPLPTGSGLLSGTPFGPIANTNGTSDTQGTNIWLTFALKGRDNITINFAQEVEKKYGFAALHPRIAARRERQRQITAAGAALERAAGGASNDDMSVDLSENESNVEMGGMDDETSARENSGKKRRKRKQEDYDKEDDFIDDTELAWEQQALMAKDGFFVYSGPLVTEEKPAVERADGTVRRGRGRGRGGAVRGETTGRGRGRGGGPGSRGGSTVRKPRVTKADRAMMEQEKQARESLAATIAAKQPLPAYAGQAGAT